jgi:hypothetical protein
MRMIPSHAALGPLYVSKVTGKSVFTTETELTRLLSFPVMAATLCPEDPKWKNRPTPRRSIGVFLLFALARCD